ncbi:ABC-2 family transporter protein [Chthonomonas calidirosea]|uniref:ABC transporter permease n=1 Tax=Chthonomonas calidirosea TaxID=454171 RepID=UPI0006DD3F17|nr:ABC transporter permease [Chthonomonas calidirosea]CEK18005.1 ABC-2 family transporter protein [Chthonomonas calidirosea]
MPHKAARFAFWWVMRKDLRILFRDRTAVVFIFGLPLIFAFIFGLIYSKAGRQGGAGISLRILAVNNDEGDSSKTFLAALHQMGLQVVPAKSIGQLRNAVLTGGYPAGLVIPSNFTTLLKGWAEHAVLGQDALSVPLLVYIDPAQTQFESLTKASIEGAVQRTLAPLIQQAVVQKVPPLYRNFAQRMLERQNQQPPVALLVHDRADKKGVAAPSPGDQVMPGLIIYFIFFMANSVAVTLIQERQEGTLRRMRCAPISPGQILVGKMLARVVVGAVQVAMLMELGKMFLNFSIGAAFLGQLLIIALCLFAAVGLGLLIAAIGRTQEQIQGLTTLALLVMGFLSGCLIPRELLPHFVQQLSYITPHAWALDAYDDLLLRHLPFSVAAMPMAILAGFGVIFFVFALLRFQYD